MKHKVLKSRDTAPGAQRPERRPGWRDHEMRPTMRPLGPQFLLLVALALSGGCRSVHRTSDDRFIPADLGKTLSMRGQTSGPPLIRYDLLYVCQWSVENNRHFYCFYRFWPDGRVMRSGWFNHMPTWREADNFSGVDVGIYHVADGQIQIEMFQQVDDNRETVLYSGEVLANGAAFTLNSMRYVDDARFWLKRSQEIAARYNAQDVGPFSRKADW